MNQYSVDFKLKIVKMILKEHISKKSIMRKNPYRPERKYPDLLEAKDTIIKDFFTNYNKAKYTYDYGDDNQFIITRLETYDFDLVPGVLEFAGKFPREDVGFTSGHLELVGAIKACNNATEEQIEIRNYYKA